MVLEYGKEHASQSHFRNTRNNGTTVLHLIMRKRTIDQNQERKEYRLLLPPISVVLEGNPPQQLENQTLFANFPKCAGYEIKNIPFLNEHQIEEIHKHGSSELMDIKQNSLELSTEINFITPNVARARSNVVIRSIRKSLSTNSPFPHLIPNLDSGDEDAEVILLRIDNPKIHCSFAYIPSQVIIVDKPTRLLIIYLGLLKEIHVDTKENILHLPGISIIIDNYSTYALEIDVKLKYAQDSDEKLEVIVKQNENPAANSSKLHVNQLPDGESPRQGEMPQGLRTRRLNVIFDSRGELRFSPSCSGEGLILRFPRPSPTRNTQNAGMQLSAGSVFARGMQNPLIPFAQMHLANGRFLLPDERFLAHTRQHSFMWNLLPGKEILQKINRQDRPGRFRRLCIELTFNDKTKFVYLPTQHIIYFNEEESIWLFEFCKLYYNKEGDPLFAGMSVKQIEDRMEIDLNAHYQFNENGVIKKLEDPSIDSYGFTENLYMTPPPIVSDAVSGQLPNGVKLQNITVCFPFRSQLGVFTDQTTRSRDNPTSSHAHPDSGPDSRAMFSTKESASSLGEKPTLPAPSSGGANPIKGRKLQERTSIQSTGLTTHDHSARQLQHVAIRNRAPFPSAPRKLATNYPRARIPAIPTPLAIPFIPRGQPIMPPAGSSLPAIMTVCLLGFHIRKKYAWISRDAYSSIILINH